MKFRDIILSLIQKKQNLKKINIKTENKNRSSMLKNLLILFFLIAIKTENLDDYIRDISFSIDNKF